MDQLLTTILTNGGAATVIGLVLLLKVMVGDRRSDRRLEAYVRSLEGQIHTQDDRIRVLEAWKESASNTLTGAGLPLPTVVTVPTPYPPTDRS